MLLKSVLAQWAKADSGWFALAQEQAQDF